MCGRIKTRLLRPVKLHPENLIRMVCLCKTLGLWEAPLCILATSPTFLNPTLLQASLNWALSMKFEHLPLLLNRPLKIFKNKCVCGGVGGVEWDSSHILGIWILGLYDIVWVYLGCLACRRNHVTGAVFEVSSAMHGLQCISCASYLWLEIWALFSQL